MIGTLWRAKTDYICFDKGDILIATRHFRSEIRDTMFICLTSAQGQTSTWREEWMGDKFERLP
jgi:hypothetical protein